MICVDCGIMATAVSNSAGVEPATASQGARMPRWKRRGPHGIRHTVASPNCMTLIMATSRDRQGRTLAVNALRPAPFIRSKAAKHYDRPAWQADRNLAASHCNKPRRIMVGAGRIEATSSARPL